VANQNEPLEILEAGTGHGSLTLHLSRAINTANTPPPPIPLDTQCQVLEMPPEDGSETEQYQRHRDASAASDDRQREWDSWRAQRRAIIHTVDISHRFSTHAEKIVRGFRRGIYAGNVDFYVSSVENWISWQIARRRDAKALFSRPVHPFLSFAILDVPSAHLRIAHVATVMKHDGILAVFMPNVTQIGECVEIIRSQRLPFVLDRAVELGVGISSGRLWDIRVTTKRSSAGDAEEGKVMEVGTGIENPASDMTNISSKDSFVLPSEDSKGREAVLVCRPKVGARIVGGGFVGIWRKIKN
jgi:tRNA A58 N-methylase Trm61